MGYPRSQYPNEADAHYQAYLEKRAAGRRAAYLRRRGTPVHRQQVHVRRNKRRTKEELQALRGGGGGGGGSGGSSSERGGVGASKRPRPSRAAEAIGARAGARAGAVPLPAVGPLDPNGFPGHIPASVQAAAAAAGPPPSGYSTWADYLNTMGFAIENTRHGTDWDKAAKWYHTVAEQGHSGAQCNLGVCYSNGRGVDKDETEAAKWYRKAAEQGHSKAQNNLGFCYDNGQGVDKDEAEAAKWYRKAAEQGYSEAQCNLGVCYESGEGVDQDEAEAVKWFHKAAEQGHSGAQYNLGICYESGEGVDQDEAEAAKWFRKAAEEGDNDAIQALARCYRPRQVVGDIWYAEEEEEAAAAGLACLAKAIPLGVPIGGSGSAAAAVVGEAAITSAEAKEHVGDITSAGAASASGYQLRSKAGVQRDDSPRGTFLTNVVC
jgi:TPR repeat protein